MRADNFAVFCLGVHICNGNFSRQTPLKRLNHAHTVVNTQHAHDVFMRMRHHFRNDHAVAADALSKHRVTEKRAARVILRAGINRAILGFHADCAAGHAADGQLHFLFFLRALGAHIPHGALCLYARFAVRVACVAFHNSVSLLLYLACFSRKSII